MGQLCSLANPSFARVVHHQHQRLTMSHSLWTSASDSCLQFIRFSIHCSSVDLVAGSVCTGATSAGTRPTSSIFVSILGGCRAVCCVRCSCASSPCWDRVDWRWVEARRRCEAEDSRALVGEGREKAAMGLNDVAVTLRVACCADFGFASSCATVAVGSGSFGADSGRAVGLQAPKEAALWQWRLCSSHYQEGGRLGD